MPTQQTVKLTGIIPTCVCGKTPHAYCTDGKLYHLEHYPCQIFTVKLSSLNAAKVEFARVVSTVRADRERTRAATHQVQGAK